MRLRNNLTEARQEILSGGIQQTNRYSLIYPQYSEEPLYPHSITLPGYGFDLIEHSMWSVIRKIPFKKTYTDLQVTFYMENKNYANFVTSWNSLMTNADGTQTAAFNNSSGVSPTNFEGSQSVVSAPEYSGNILENNKNIGIAGGGGAVNYINTIYNNFVQVNLLSETSPDKINSSFIFREAFISQIAPTQLTSVETGYSLFTVFFKFAKVQVIN